MHKTHNLILKLNPPKFYENKFEDKFYTGLSYTTLSNVVLYNIVKRHTYTRELDRRSPLEEVDNIKETYVHIFIMQFLVWSNILVELDVTRQTCSIKQLRETTWRVCHVQ